MLPEGIQMKLYLHIFEDCSYCETCGYNYGTIYTLSEYPFNSDEGHNCFSSGTGATCYGGRDGSIQDVIDYINKTYNKELNLNSLNDSPTPETDTYEAHQDQFNNALISYFKDNGIELDIMCDEATIDDYDDDYDGYDDYDDYDYNDYNDPDDERYY